MRQSFHKYLDATCDPLGSIVATGNTGLFLTIMLHRYSEGAEPYYEVYFFIAFCIAKIKCFNYDVTLQLLEFVCKTELIIQDNLYKKIGIISPRMRY